MLFSTRTFFAQTSNIQGLRNSCGCVRSYVQFSGTLAPWPAPWRSGRTGAGGQRGRAGAAAAAAAVAAAGNKATAAAGAAGAVAGRPIPVLLTGRGQ